ncbi:MAG TPA: radical SAM protein, partial [Rhodothermales bacterium]
RIAIIKLFYGMTITSAQLAGQLKAGGHVPLVVMFKRQAFLLADKLPDPDYELGDTPMTGFMVNKDGVSAFESSVWKKTSEQELNNLKAVLAEFRPDAIGISTLSWGMTLAGRISEFLRKHFTVPLLWGGTGPTLEPDRSMQFADLVCVGEGENILDEIGQRLNGRQPLDGINGTWCRLPDGSIQKNPKRPVSNLEEIAVPAWESSHMVLIDGDTVERNFSDTSAYRDRSYQMMTQRGCPFACSFCVESFYQKEFGKKDSLRRMSPQKAIRELKHAKDVLGYETVTFMDDVFTVNPRWLTEFCELYKKEIGLPFFCYTYPGVHDFEMLRMLEDAGCHAITIGVQSGSQRILNEVFDRRTRVDRIVESIEDIVRSGIPAATFDMIPATKFDTEQDLKDTFELLLKIPKELDTTFYGQMTYYPNYPIMDKFRDDSLTAKAGGLTPDDYAYYIKLCNLTRTDMPVDQIVAISKDEKYRLDHNLLDPMLKDDSILKANFGLLVDVGIERRARTEHRATPPGAGSSAQHPHAHSAGSRP